MTKHECAILAAFLEELDDRYGNDGCNDMMLANTPENRRHGADGIIVPKE